MPKHSSIIFQRVEPNRWNDDAGWRCQGGVSYEYIGGLTSSGYYLQAMIK